MENNKPDFEALAKQNFAVVNPDGTEAPGPQPYAMRKGYSLGCEHVWNTYVVPLQERLTLEKESNDLLHQAMTSAESRGVQKGREEMESDNKALREKPKRIGGEPFPENKAVRTIDPVKSDLNGLILILKKDKMELESKNKALLEEIERLKSSQRFAISESIHLREENQRLKLEMNMARESIKTRDNEIEILKSEVLKEKFPEN